MNHPTSNDPSVLLSLLIPGPSRKRTPSTYHFRNTFRNPELASEGCVATWKVMGGREEYQISLERTERAELRWHCCCADAVFREDSHKGHRCKHIRGLVQALDAIAPPKTSQSVAA
jgi:hypothetical protein